MISKFERRVAGIDPWEHYKVNHHMHVDLSLNFNSIPYERDVAIIVTAWYGQLHWLKATFTNYRLSGAFVVGAYDQPIAPWSSYREDDIAHFPYIELWSLPHSWVFPHLTFDSKKREGWFWDVKYGSGVIRNFPHFEYVFTVNGDCIWEKPEGMRDLIELLGDGDLMAVSSSGRTIHTCAMLFKAEALYKVMDYMSERKRCAVMGSHSPEALLFEAVGELGLKEVVVPNQPLDHDGTVDHYCRLHQDSTWKELVGFRNLEAEQQESSISGTEPVPGEYLALDRAELLFGDNERRNLVPFYETGDRRWLYKYWLEGEDSWHNRIYYPLEELDHPVFKTIYPEDKDIDKSEETDNACSIPTS
jgi:hypothetical protein